MPELGELRGAEVQRLGHEQAAQKLAAMRTYATQFPCVNYGGLLLEHPGIHGFEVRWALRPGVAGDG